MFHKDGNEGIVFSQRREKGTVLSQRGKKAPYFHKNGKERDRPFTKTEKKGTVFSQTRIRTSFEKDKAVLSQSVISQRRGRPFIWTVPSFHRVSFHKDKAVLSRRILSQRRGLPSTECPFAKTRRPFIWIVPSFHSVLSQSCYRLFTKTLPPFHKDQT